MARKTTTAVRKVKSYCSVCDEEKPPIAVACLSCCFWNGWYRDRQEPNVVIAKGHLYVFFYDPNGYGPKGYGGKNYAISFNDGRIVTTNDLWHVGEVPLIWQLFGLTDNAITKELTNHE